MGWRWSGEHKHQRTTYKLAERMLTGSKLKIYKKAKDSDAEHKRPLKHGKKENYIPK